MRKILFTSLMMLASGAFISNSVSAQTQTSVYRPGVTPKGVVYYLPKTSLRISVLIEKTTYTPGEFYKYAEKYLRLSNVSEDAAASYKVIDTDITSYGVADTMKVYSIKLNPKTSAPNVKLSDEGILLAVNTTATMPEAAPVKFKPAKKKEKADPRQFMSQEILAAGSVAKMAELTASEIYNIRESKNALTRGEADFMPKDGEQMKLMLDNLDEQDAALSSLFSGTIEKDTTQIIFTYCPDKSTDKKVLFRLSKKLGVLDNDDLAGAPYYISIEDLKTVPAEAPLDEKAKKKKDEDINGLYVNVPSKMKVTLYNGNKEIDSYETKAGQFGYVELLSGDLFNKKFTTHLTLNPQTGAVEKLDLEQPK